MRANNLLVCLVAIVLFGASAWGASSKPATSAARNSSKEAAQAVNKADKADAQDGSKQDAPKDAVKENAAPAAAQNEQGQASDEEFSLRVKGMEEQVNDLKEKIFRTKARLMLLQESILGGGALGQGAKAVLVHKNEMGSSYYLESAAYALDGAPVFTKVDVDGDLDKKQDLEIFNGRIVPGQHQIAVRLQFRGHGYGIFSYLEGYKFKVQSSYTFDAEPGKTTNIKIIAHERGGITTDLKERPAVRYDLERSTESGPNKIEAKAEDAKVQEAATRP